MLFVFVLMLFVIVLMLFVIMLFVIVLMNDFGYIMHMQKHPVLVLVNTQMALCVPLS